MKYNLILVRYGEIALKGKVTRNSFENRLVSNIKNALNSRNIDSKIKKEWGRIYVYSNQIDNCIEVLKKIFGITSVSPVFKTTSSMDAISEIAVEISKKQINSKKSFAVRASRTGKHDFSSQDVAVKVGDAIVNATKAKVNLTKPDFELFIEVRNKKSFLFTEKIRCIGGMPLGTQGNFLSIINSKDSILSAWYIMRRGCNASFIVSDNFDLKILKSFLSSWFIDSKVTIAEPDKINEIAHLQNCDAIVTGDSLLHDAENTLNNLIQLKNQIGLPILHPLIAMSQDEITKKCKEIGL